MKQEEQVKKQKRLHEEAPVKGLMLALRFLDDDKANLKRECLVSFVTKNKGTFAFARVSNRPLRYAKRDEIIDVIRRWMIEDKFDPDEAPKSGEPRDINSLLPLLVPNSAPEDEPGGPLTLITTPATNQAALAPT